MKLQNWVWNFGLITKLPLPASSTSVSLHLVHRRRRTPAPATWADRCRAPGPNHLVRPWFSQNRPSWHHLSSPRAPAIYELATATAIAELLSHAPPPAELPQFALSPAVPPPGNPLPPPATIKGQSPNPIAGKRRALPCSVCSVRQGLSLRRNKNPGS